MMKIKPFFILSFTYLLASTISAKNPDLLLKFRFGGCNFITKAKDSFAKNNPGIAWDLGAEYNFLTRKNYIFSVDFLISQRTQMFESKIPAAYSAYFKPSASRQIYSFGTLGLTYKRFLEDKPKWFWATGVRTGFYLNPNEINKEKKLVPIPRDDYNSFNMSLEGELGLKAFEYKEGYWHQFSILLQAELIGFKNNPYNDKNYRLLTYQLCYRLPL